MQPQVGTAGYRVDIGVKHPGQAGQFALGVECDGSMYHSSKVARDRDRLRQEVLERLGWRLHRIWGTAWYRNRPEQEQRLRAAIEAAIAGDGYKPTLRPKLKESRSVDERAFEPVALDDAPEWTTPYRVAVLSPIAGRQLEMHTPEAQPLLRKLIVDVVEQEGPVLDELVLRRVREAWGVGRAGHRIRGAFDRAIASLSRRGDIKKVGDRFLSSDEGPIANVRIPGEDPAARRSVDEVPRDELRLAVLHLVEHTRRVSRDELTFEVARLFGWNRRGPDIAAALDRAVDKLLRNEQIVSDGDYIKVR